MCEAAIQRCADTCGPRVRSRTTTRAHLQRQRLLRSRSVSLACVSASAPTHVALDFVQGADGVAETWSRQQIEARMLEVNAHPAVTCVTLFQQAPLKVRQLCQDSNTCGVELAEVLL